MLKTVNANHHHIKPRGDVQTKKNRYKKATHTNFKARGRVQDFKESKI